MTDLAAPTVLATVALRLDPVKVGELARALRTGPPARVRSGVQPRGEEAEPLPIPPTATVLAAHTTPSGESPNELIIAAAGLDQARVVLGELTWAYRRGLRLGEALTGAVSLRDSTVHEGRRGGSLIIARGATAWHDETGDEVCTTTVTLIEPAAVAVSASASAPEPSADKAGPGQLSVSRTDIVRYAGASGDYNPVHHDEPYARRLGFPSVFAMGLLPGGILAARASDMLSAPLRHLSLRFQGLVWPDVVYDLDRTRVTDGLELNLIQPDGGSALRVRALASDPEQGGA